MMDTRGVDYHRCCLCGLRSTCIITLKMRSSKNFGTRLDSRFLLPVRMSGLLELLTTFIDECLLYSLISRNVLQCLSNAPADIFGFWSRKIDGSWRSPPVLTERCFCKMQSLASEKQCKTRKRWSLEPQTENEFCVYINSFKSRSAISPRAHGLLRTCKPEKPSGTLYLQ